MKNLLSKLFKKTQISDLAFKHTLDNLKQGQRVTIVRRNGSVFIGDFVDGNGKEIVVKTESKFLGIPKTEIADISLDDSGERKPVAPPDPTRNQCGKVIQNQVGPESDRGDSSAGDSTDLNSIIQQLRDRPDIDPELDTSLMAEAAGGNMEALRNLFRFFSKHRWICQYDGKKLKCPKLARIVSIPKIIKGDIKDVGYYLCTIYAVKGIFPPILVLSTWEKVSINMKNLPYVPTDEVPSRAGHTEETQNQPSQQTRPITKNATLKAKLINSMRNLFLPGFVYSLAEVGTRLRSFGFDASAYGFSKLSTMFEWLKGEMVEMGKDRYDLPTVKFKFGPNDGEAITIAPQFALQDFLLVIKNVGGFGHGYSIEELEAVLSQNGFSATTCGFDSLESLLRSFPSEHVHFEESNGEVVIWIIGGTAKTDPAASFLDLQTNSTVSQVAGVDDQKDFIALPETEPVAQSNVDKERKGIVTAFYAKRHIGFLIETQTNQTWYFHESKIKDGQLLDCLASGKVGIDVLFSGNDKILPGKYPAVDGLKSFSATDMTMQESEDDISFSKPAHKQTAIWPSGFSPIADYRMRNCPYEGVDARSLKAREFTEKDLKTVQRRLTELRQTRGYIPFELSKFQLTIVTLKYILGWSKESVASALSYYFRLCGEAAILSPDLSPQVANFYAVESLKVAEPDHHFLLSCLYLLANTYDNDIPFVKGNKTTEDLRGLLNQMQQRGSLERLAESIPYLKRTIPTVVQPLVDLIRTFASIPPKTTIQTLEESTDLVSQCESMSTISAVYFSQFRDLLIQRLGQYSSYEREMLSAFTENLSLLVEYAQKKHFLEKESLFLRQKQFLHRSKISACQHRPLFLLKH